MKKSETNYYMAWCLDNEILKNSSSGGIFSVLACQVLKENGVVFGAYQNPDTFELSHKAIFTIENIDLLRKSKYYQSSAFNSYQQAKKYLLQNRTVLFSGTACQIAGVNAILSGVDTTKLITIDVLCHGVSNHKVFTSYVKSKRRKSNKEITAFDFRTKKVPWLNGGGTSMTLHYGDGTEDTFPNDIDTYYLAFNSNLILRDSCYNCKYAGPDKPSDITLADFWGVSNEAVSPNQLNKGVGLVIVNSEKGMKIWKDIQELVHAEPTLPHLAIPYNLALEKSQDKHPNRDSFFRELSKNPETDFDKIVNRFLWKEIITIRSKKFIGKILHKFLSEDSVIRLKKFLKIEH